MKIATFVALLLTLGLLSAACLPDLHWRSEAERKSAPAPAPTKPPTPKPTETPLPTDTPVPVLIPTADELRLDPTLLDEWAYSDCLDEIYLRAHASYSSDHWLPAAVWHCQHLAPPPSNDLYPNRCILNSVRSASARYPEWNKLLTHWYAIAQCYPDATASRSQPDLPDVVVTDYGACLDNVFLTLLHRIDDGDMHVGISAWYCQRYLPIPAPSEECQDTHMDATDVLYSEWPEAMHRWHAVMHCEPHWSPPDDATGDFYEACLDGVYRSVNEEHSKKVAIAAAVWRCRAHMPEPPAAYHPRCEINHQRKDDAVDEADAWPAELRIWHSLVLCYPTPRLRMR